MKYIKIELNNSGDYSIGEEHGMQEKDALRLFVENFCPKKFCEVVKDEDRNIIEYNDFDIKWFQETNAVILEEDWDNFIVVKFDDFKKMAQKLLTFQKKGYFEIYFIQTDDGSIFIQDSLELR